MEPSVAYLPWEYWNAVSPEVTRTEPDGIDYGWILQVTFIASIVVGAPLVAILSIPVTLDTWPERARFAAGIGSMVWFFVGIAVYLYARHSRE